MSDVDWEGADVQDSLGAVLGMAMEQGVLVLPLVLLTFRTASGNLETK
ncbi:hypothetical protein AZE42_11767 [Rhizopogon vesiculosus]|uniref:Uncharacterized protein n=1 Tax=Rhizopogon vesiculosus TaxID=180088 RepID=A0A1J8Q1B6_9AGAM|nr:hypothetical protein AZE42_11767 [Rhizopogon vesiculosus]